MKRILLSLGVLSVGLLNGQQYDGKVGVNEVNPQQELDVNGNARIQGLIDANNSTEFTRTVVARNDGTLGYVTGVKKTLVNITSHTANGLYFNTGGKGKLSIGRQTVFIRYGLFGEHAPEYDLIRVGEDGSETHEQARPVFKYPAKKPGFSNKNTKFAAQAGDVLRISSDITFQVQQNNGDAKYQRIKTERTSGPNESDDTGFPTKETDLRQDFPVKGYILEDASSTGDRQVILYMYLYKGTELKKETKLIANFLGRQNNNGEYDDVYRRTISMNYVVPENESATDYSVTVVVGAFAPDNAMFRTDFHGRFYDPKGKIYNPEGANFIVDNSNKKGYLYDANSPISKEPFTQTLIVTKL